MRKPKIVHVTSVHPALDPRIFHKQAVSLVKAGYEVVLIAPHPQDAVVHGVRIKATPTAGSRLRRPATIWRSLRLARMEGASVYHLHDPELIIGAAMLKALTRANVIYDVHEDVRSQILNKNWIPRGLRRTVSFIYGQVEKVCLLFVDKIVIVIDRHRSLYPQSEKVVCIRNYPLEHASPARAVPVLNDRDNITLVYVGVISEHRGVFQLLEAMRMLNRQSPAVRLELVGSIDSSALETELHSRIARYGLGRSVNLKKQLAFGLIGEILASSDIGLCVLMPLPNYVESLPTKLFEYMTAGLPVIASDFPIFKEIVEGNNCGLTVDPLDAKAVADAVTRLVSNPDAARDMGINGRRAVLRQYSWEAEEKKMLKMYKELSGSG